jgi:5-methylcytosine-specific restriction protein A
MPFAAKRPCLQPGCAGLVAKGYCAEHAKTAQLYDKHRGTAASRGYDAAWDKVKREVLERDRHLCQPCKRKSKTVAASEVDHIVSLADGGGRLDRKNLESTCHSCHVKKTWRERWARTGGAGNPSGSARR